MRGRFEIKKFRCKNGEIVSATEQDSILFINYKGKIYKRSIDIIGEKLFLIEDNHMNHNSNAVAVGKNVCIKNISTGETLNVKISDVHPKRRYRRMGGSYYGNSVETVYVGDDIGLKNGIQTISTGSPLGKALLNKFCGDIVMVSLPGGEFERYKIISVE